MDKGKTYLAVFRAGELCDLVLRVVSLVLYYYIISWKRLARLTLPR